jgi:hypothetical protein
MHVHMVRETPTVKLMTADDGQRHAGACLMAQKLLLTVVLPYW